MNNILKEILEQDVITTTSIKKLPLYNVVFYNDNFTPFEFVELLLTSIFNKTKDEAKAIALKIHNDEKCIVATYTKEVANTKKHLVEINSVENGYPLKCEIELNDD